MVLTSPVFFRNEDWIKTPADWSNSIVKGKSYSTTEAIGNALWQEVQAKLDLYRASVPQARPGESLIVNNDSPLYGNPTITKVRIGQGAFRVLVMDGYGRRCSITGERTLPVLEAAHIQSYADAGPNALNNGILLRSDMHKFFDTGYLTVTKDLHVEVSSRINQEFHNGKEYYKHHGQKLLYLPGDLADMPNPQYLEWHNANCFKG